MNIANSLTVDTNITYCPVTLNLSQPLNITNVSQHELVFKVKTNKKNFISMNPCNGFIKPLNTLSIPVKIVQNVPENVSIKLQVDWALVTPEMKQKNDIKMATVNEKDIYKKIFPIIRKQQPSLIKSHQIISNDSLKSSREFLAEIKKPQEEKKITPFEYQKKQQEKHEVQSPKKPVESIIKQEEIVKSMVSPVKQKIFAQDQISDDTFQYRSSNNMLTSLPSPTKGLQIVSEQDEEDHQKELQHIRSQQVQEFRKIDQIKSKSRKLTQQIKSTEIIDPKFLFLAIIACFLLGSFLQYLVF